VATRRVRRAAVAVARSRLPVQPAASARARRAQVAPSLSPAQRVARRRSRASVSGRVAGVAAAPVGARTTPEPVPVPEGTPGLDNATATTTPEQAS
jgi:hypothetical protein